MSFMSSVSMSSVSASSQVGISSFTSRPARRQIPSSISRSRAVTSPPLTRPGRGSNHSQRTASESMSDRPRHKASGSIMESSDTVAPRRRTYDKSAATKDKNYPRQACAPTVDWNHPLCENPCFDAAIICEACFCPCLLFERTHYSLKAISHRQDPMDFGKYRSCVAPCWICVGLMFTPAFCKSPPHADHGYYLTDHLQGCRG